MRSMVGKEVRAYRQRLQAQEQELISSIAKIEVDGRTFTDIGTQDLADKANGSFTKESLFQQSDYDRAILRSSAGSFAAGGKWRLRPVCRMRRAGGKEAARGGTLGAALHALSETARQGAAMRLPAEVSLLE